MDELYLPRNLGDFLKGDFAGHTASLTWPLERMVSILTWISFYVQWQTSSIIIHTLKRHLSYIPHRHSIAHMHTHTPDSSVTVPFESVGLHKRTQLARWWSISMQWIWVHALCHFNAYLAWCCGPTGGATSAATPMPPATTGLQVTLAAMKKMECTRQYNHISIVKL